MAKKNRFPKQRGHKNLWDTTKETWAHCKRKGDRFQKGSQYEFNDVQVCDISLLSAGKYSREAESIYCLLAHKNHDFVGKMKSCMAKNVQSKTER